MKKIYFNLTLGLLTVFSLTIQSQVNVILGSGTTAHSTTDAGPINEFYRSLHAQTVYTAAELNAAGVFGGTITKLGWYVVSGVTNPLPNYSIKLKHTSATNASAYDATGLTQYYINSSYSPVAGGFDMLTLSTPFMWNGVDNILLDVCFDQVSAYTSTGVVRIYNTSVPNGYIYARADGAPQCGVACSTSMSTKPQIQFEFLPPSPFDLGINAFVTPLTSKKCYANDTIIVRLKNYGSATADFSTNPTTITVNTTGPSTNTYTLALTSGSIASTATQDYTMTTNFNLSNIGTYKLKGYTTASGDGTALNDTANLTLTRSPLFTTSILPNDTVCLGIPVQLNANYSPIKQVGAGTIQNTSTSYPAPYGNFYEGARHQFLVLASELSAAGVVAGNVNSISFNATNLNSSGSYLNYKLAIATTTLTNITAFQTAGFTTYFTSANYTPVLGANTHTLSTPFVWDGVSNIIIETCFDNTSTGYTENVSVSQSTTPFTSSVWRNEDSNPSICSATALVGSMAQRPNIGFGQATSITYSWSPASELSASNIANPVANVSGTKTYTITGDLSGCITYDTVRIVIKSTPTPNLGNDTTFCSLPVIINANTTANSFLWNNGSIGSSINVINPGKYWVRATNSNGCSLSDTINISLGQFPIVTLGSDTTFCQGGSITLYAGYGAGNTYAWNTGATTPTLGVSTVGSYSVVVTNTTGCVSSDAINVGVSPLPTVNLAFSSPYAYCVSDNVSRLLNEGTPTGGVYIGAGVSTSGSNSYFDPHQAGQGSHIIVYSYTSPGGCSNIAKDTLIVNACVGIEELTDNINVNVFPNPSTGKFTFELNTNSTVNGKLNVLTVDGRLVYTTHIEGNGTITSEINLSNLASGVYYLKFESKDALKTYKILKQ